MDKKKNQNKKSFYFEEYQHSLKTNLEKKLNISDDRIYLLFFVFFTLIFIFAIKILLISFQDSKGIHISKNYLKYKNIRSDIVDRNGILIARNIKAYNAAIKPELIKDKKKFLIKLKILYPEIESKSIKKKISNKKYFYFKKNISEDERNKLWSLGEKGFIFEGTQTRVYPHKNLFSHVVGQIDSDNIGISGIEKSYDDKLKSDTSQMVLTLDTNLQYLIRRELIKYQGVFRNKGSAAILMDINSGEILSLVSLPDFDLNKRKLIDDKNFINRATKGLYELGSVFKTFTLASALQEEVIQVNTEFKNLPKKLNCAGRYINEYDEKIPSNLTAEQILIRSGNIGSVRIAQKVGEKKLKDFLNKIGVTTKIDFDIDEVGNPISI